MVRNIKISIKQLTANKIRTALALTGIIIGVSAVIIMIAIGTGAQRDVLGKIEEMGTNLVIVNAAEVPRSPGREQFRGTVTTLTLQDAEILERSATHIEAAAPVQSRRMQVRFGNRTTTINVTGTTPQYQEVRNFKVWAGSFFDEHDDIMLRRVAVIGSGVYSNLFDGTDAIGKTVRIGNVPFEIIGIMQPKGTDIDGVDQDNQIFIPIRTALRRVFNLNYIQTVYVQAQHRDVMESTATSIRKILRERHRLFSEDQPDDFNIHTQIELLDAQRETTEAFTLLIGSMAGVSLLVGGIGILAIMLISVRERINEIGLRRAVGARRKDILGQFLIEASLLGIGGGIAGIIIGIGGSFLIGVATDWSTGISAEPVALSVLFSVSIGLIFGVYPASKASFFDPIEALRSE